MRMWMVNMKIICCQHLLSEQAEINMFIGTLILRKTGQGYLEKGLLEFHNLYCRPQERS